MSTEGGELDAGEGHRYNLADYTQYRNEPDIGVFMIYNIDEDVFRTAGELAHQIVVRVEEGLSTVDIADALGVDEDAVVEFCEECAREGFFQRIE